MDKSRWMLFGVLALLVITLSGSGFGYFSIGAGTRQLFTIVAIVLAMRMMGVGCCGSRRCGPRGCGIGDEGSETAED